MSDPGLNDLQIEVLHLFFSLPESDGFVLAGGAGLVATGLSLRPHSGAMSCWGGVPDEMLGRWIGQSMVEADL